MSEPLDSVLKLAKRDRNGNVAIAHLRREDEDAWDALVVREDGQPLVYWATGEKPEMGQLVTGEGGSVLMVVVSTPPGVEPGGLLTIPANAWGSPLGTLVSLVSDEGHTVISPPREERVAMPPPPMGHDMLRSLLNQAAAHTGHDWRVTDLETADGGTTTVLLDWDGRPLMYWVEMPGEEPKRALMVAVALRETDGFIAMAVDDELRPLHSGAATKKLFGDGEQGAPE